VQLKENAHNRAECGAIERGCTQVQLKEDAHNRAECGAVNRAECSTIEGVCTLKVMHTIELNVVQLKEDAHNRAECGIIEGGCTQSS